MHICPKARPTREAEVGNEVTYYTLKDNGVKFVWFKKVIGEVTKQYCDSFSLGQGCKYKKECETYKEMESEV